MSTKEDQLFLKQQKFASNYSHFEKSSQFSIHNLNQSLNCLQDFVSPNQAFSKSNIEKKSATFELIGNTVIDNYQEKGKSWNKSTKDLSFKTSKNPRFNYKTEEKKKHWKNDKNDCVNKNSSTLSLHIAAYENSMKVAPNEIKKFSFKSGAFKQIDSLSKIQAHRDFFEFPRQMDGNEPATPEVQQFKSSQKLLSSNQTAPPKEAEQKNVVAEDVHSEQEEEFQADGEKVQKAVDFIMLQNEIGGWKIEKIIGAGANGGMSEDLLKDFVIAFTLGQMVVARVKHSKSQQICVMKFAISSASFHSLVWEGEVMEKIMRAQGEDRTQHIVRRKDAGLTKGPEGEAIPYVVMENLPGNPVSIIGCCVGDELITKVCEYGLQLLKAIYDLHKCGFLHRDIKPENLGLYKKEILVLYDLGMARSLIDPQGNLREPRSNIGMRGTDEWASLSAELGKDQGPVDDLWGWFYVMVEWMNCTSKSPLAWAAFDDRPEIRHFMKSNNFPSRLVLRGCPKEFFKIQAYLRALGRCDSPNYFYLATLLKSAKLKAENNDDSGGAAEGGKLKENGPKTENRENAMEKIISRMNREEVYFSRV